MKVHEYTADAEREVLIAMITSEAVAGRIASQWRPEGLFAAKNHNVIGGWVAEHWKKYRKVLDTGIAAKFNEWAAEQNSNETVEGVKQVLSYLSQESQNRAGEAVNVDYVLDMARKRFTENRIVRTAEDSISLCRAKRVDRADSLMKGYGAGGCDLIGTPGVDLFLDREMVAKVFSKDRAEPLVRYGGQLGHFFANKLARDSLVAFCGPAGFGKSWWLADVAWRAMLDRKRVAYFDVGDMSDVQVGERFLIRAAGRPRLSDNGEWPFTVKVPKTLAYSGKVPEVEFEERKFKSELDEIKAWAACERIMQTKVKSKRSYFKLVNMPSKTVTVPDLAGIVKGWEMDGWVPDVIVIDYADILAPINKRADELTQTDDTWVALRSLSQQLHCLVVTATQTNREAFGKGEVKMNWIGGHFRKLAHVNAMWGINAKDGWTENQVTVLHDMKQRSAKKLPPIYVANCLALADPAVLSCYRTWAEEGEAAEVEPVPSRNGRHKRGRG